MIKNCSRIKQRILEIIAASGEVYRNDLMSVSTNSKDYIRQNLSELKADNLIKESSFEGERTLRLTNVGKKYLTEMLPRRYADYFKGIGVTNKPRSNPQRRQRILRTAQAIILFRQTGVKIFPDEKVLLYSDSVLKSPDNTDNIDSEFYSSMELKELLIEFKKSRGSRAIGILITKSCVYIVYNTGKEPMKWQMNTELKFRLTVEKEIVRKVFGNKKKVKWLVIGEGTNMPDKLFDKNDSGKNQYMSIHADATEKNFIRFNRCSLPIVKLITDEEHYIKIKQRIREEYGFETRGTSRFNEVDEDGNPIIFALDFDMRLVNDFISHLYASKRQGNIVCFGIQAIYLKRFKDAPVGIYDVNYQDFEGVV